MITNEDIVNQALGLLSASPIVSLSDDSVEGKIVRLSFYNLRDAVLEELDWSFAKAIFSLAKDVVPPDHKWSNRFLIPDETLRVVSVNGNKRSQPWEINGNYIMADFDSADVVAINRVDNPNYFSNMFVQALVFRLAWTWAVPLVKSKTLARQYKEDYVDLINEAISSDSMQGTPENIGQGRLIESRIGIGSGFIGPEV